MWSSILLAWVNLWSTVHFTLHPCVTCMMPLLGRTTRVLTEDLRGSFRTRQTALQRIKTSTWRSIWQPTSVGLLPTGWCRTSWLPSAKMLQIRIGISSVDLVSVPSQPVRPVPYNWWPLLAALVWASAIQSLDLTVQTPSVTHTTNRSLGADRSTAAKSVFITIYLSFSFLFLTGSCLEL